MSTCGIHSMEPVQERLGWPHYNRRSVDHVHGSKVLPLICSSCVSIVVVEHPTEPLAPPDLAGASRVRRIGHDEAVAESLVIAFNMIMRGKFLDRFSQ